MVRSLIQRYSGLFAIGWIGVVAIIVLAERLAQIPIHVSLNYNEGWNAYQAAYAFGPEPLYPPLDALVSNNYPPLSFYIVGGIGQILGDNVIAGRWVSLLSMVAVAMGVGWLVGRRLGQSALGVFTGLFFLAAFAHYYRGYVGIDDPQMLAHALQMGVLVWLIEGWRDQARSGGRADTGVSRSLVGASVLMGFSLLVKHNLLAMPAAIAIWLFMHRRRASFAFVAIVTGMVAISFGLFHLIYGPNFLTGLLEAPRTYSLLVGVANMERWLEPQGWLIGLGVFLGATQWRDLEIQLMGWFAGFSLLLGMAIAGGAGVNYNAVFDATIALCLLVGLALSQQANRYPLAQTNLARPSQWRLSSAQFAAAIALCVLFLTFLPTKLQTLSTVVADTQALRLQAAEDVALIASYEDPVICEHLAMCYFAGKPLGIELFNFGQKLRSGLISEADWIEQVESQAFSLFYMKKDSELLTKPVYQAISAYYEPFRLTTYRNYDYEFWRPRSAAAGG